MRLFIAADLEEAALDNLFAFGHRMYMRFHKQGRLVARENLHLTLHFLGEVDSSVTSEIGDVLGEVAASFGPIFLRFDQVGAFPDSSRPRVVWVGTKEACPILVQMQQAVEQTVIGHALKFESRTFVPHVTLIRYKSNPNLGNLIEHFRGQIDQHTSILSLSLFESCQSTGGGNNYRRVHRYPLLSE